jgi:hypothetical protein
LALPLLLLLLLFAILVGFPCCLGSSLFTRDRRPEPTHKKNKIIQKCIFTTISPMRDVDRSFIRTNIFEHLAEIK